MQYRKKPVVVEASQWFKNGDHPLDNAIEMFDYPDSDSPDAGITQRPHVVREGKVVRYYRHPDVSGDTPCEQCGQSHHVHGWIDTLEQGHRVCPGDWIITGVKGERYPCKQDIFAATYEPADEQAQQDADKVDAQAYVWTPGPDEFKDWCANWFGPDSDESYLAKAVFNLPPMAQRFKNSMAPPAPAMEGDEWLAKTTYLIDLLSGPARAAINEEPVFDELRQLVGKRVQPATGDDVRDAARYRWLRKPDSGVHITMAESSDPVLYDKAIDAAMQQERQP